MEKGKDGGREGEGREGWREKEIYGVEREGWGEEKGE